MSTGQKIEPRTSQFVLGTAGHIDHGKTALVYALTGTDTDRLPEEKARGITIDLGFADLELDGPGGQSVRASLIDVPGHHAFVRNMLAGVGGIDAVMLVIAADEGFKPQTEEHLAICSLLGVSQGLVVLTKTDLVDAERLARACEEVRTRVRGTFLDGAPIVPVSAFTRDGLPALRSALFTLGSGVPRRDDRYVSRLPIDRVFSVRGFGTVVTGTLQSGHASTGDEMRVLPSERLVRVRGMQVHKRQVDSAQAPSRVALNLASVQVENLRRGDVLAAPGTISCTSAIDADLTMLAGCSLPKHRSTLRVHAFASESIATVLRYDAASGEPGRIVRLELASPLVLLPGDRFVIRRASPAATTGGGRVLDAHPLPRVRKSERQRFLIQLAGASKEEQLYLRVLRRGREGIPVAALIEETGLTGEAILAALAPMLSAGRLERVLGTSAQPQHVIAADALAQAVDALVEVLKQSAAPAVAHGSLRSRLRLSLPVFDVAVARLVGAKVVERDGDALLLAGRRPAALPAGPASRVEEMFRAAGLASPLLSEVSAKLAIAAPELRALVTDLLRAKRLVRMGADNLMTHAEPLAELIRKLRQHRGERFDVARFKAFTGLTRKHVIPLLEYLDGQRVTRKDNGTRIVL